MFLNFLSVRKEFEVDTILQDFKFPELQQLKKYFDFCCHGIDKLGRPILIEKMGVLDMAGVLRVTTSERLIQYLRYKSEERMKIRLPICSELAGRRIETICVI
jgi:hypothetical protein